MKIEYLIGFMDTTIIDLIIIINVLHQFKLFFQILKFILISFKTKNSYLKMTNVKVKEIKR